MSTSAEVRGAPVHSAMPRWGSFMVHVPSPRPSPTTRPVVPGVARGAPAGRFSAHATWAEPGPWHSSHDTVSSAHVVAYRFVARSYRFRRSVEWHSAHWKF